MDHQEVNTFLNDEQEGKVRILARQLGRLLHEDELDAVAGGRMSTESGAGGGDCDA